MPVAVLGGLGSSNEAVAKKLGSEGWKLYLSDDLLTDDRLDLAARLGIECLAAPTDLPDHVDVVVPSPGLPYSHPLVRLAAERGLPIRCEIGLAAERTAIPMAAVTGTNGKTMTTTLVAAMVEAAGQRVRAAGNISPPLISVIDEPLDSLVVEVSSFQLYYGEGFAPQAAAWLNFSENHLDWHPNTEHYRAAKARLWDLLVPGGTAVVNIDDPVVRKSVEGKALNSTRYSIEAGPSEVEYGWDRSARALTAPGGSAFVSIDDIPRSLPHELSNALAATALAVSMGASLESCASVLESFKGLPHRVELVGEHDGISYYDDSKSTSPASTIAACSGFESVVLLAGGRNKNTDLTALRKALPSLRAVVAFGECREQVRSALEASVTVTLALSMDEAVRSASKLAQSGDAVLLSPAAASWDAYNGYAARGDDFARAVKELMRQ